MGSANSTGVQADSCSNCDIAFTRVTRRNRRICLECQSVMCTTCLQATNDAPSPSKLPRLTRRVATGICVSCTVMLAPDPTNQQLAELKVKHLKGFLIRRNIAEVSNCVEKKDLIDLILANIGSQSYRDRQLAEQQRNEELLARQRVHPASSSDSPTLEEPPREPPVQGGDTSSEFSMPSQADPEVKQGPDSLSKFSLNEIESMNEVENLSVKQLKMILTRNLVNYRGCKEKHELVAKVKMLWQSRQANQRLYEQLLNPPESEEGVPGNREEPELCKICMDSAIDCVLLDCGHMVTCTKCGKQMNECPICRQYVIRAVHIFRA